jgi:hypothetical protein
LTPRLPAALVASLVAVQPALAQERSDTVIVSVNAGAQLETARLDERISLEKYVETTPLEAMLGNQAVPFFDLGVTFHIAGGFGANVAFSTLSDTGTANLRAEIPHPFYFDRRRDISGQVPNVRRQEQVFHTNVAYVIEGEALDIVIAGGASFFSVKQDFVTDVHFTEEFPFDTAVFTAATLTRATASKTGFNASADLTWKINDAWGVGGLVRFSRARIPLTAGGIDFGTVDAGGVQAGGGLRLIF